MLLLFHVSFPWIRWEIYRGNNYIFKIILPGKSQVESSNLAPISCYLMNMECCWFSSLCWLLVLAWLLYRDARTKSWIMCIMHIHYVFTNIPSLTLHILKTHTKYTKHILWIVSTLCVNKSKGNSLWGLVYNSRYEFTGEICFFKKMKKTCSHWWKKTTLFKTW